MKINISTSNSDESLRKEVNNRIDLIMRRCHNLQHFLFLRSCRKNTPCYCLLSFLQKSALISITLFLLLTISFNIFQSSPRFALLFISLFFDFLLLLVWNSLKEEEKFFKFVLRTSNGYSIVRNTKHILRISNVILVGSTIFSILLISLYAGNTIFVVATTNELGTKEYLLAVSSLAFLLLAIAATGINSEFSALLTILSTQFTTLSSDFGSDINSSQVVVIKHYMRAHIRLCTLTKSFSKFISVWISAKLVLCLSLSHILIFDHNCSIQELSIFVVFLFFTFLTLFVFSILCLRLHDDMKGFCKKMMQLAVSERILHEQSYWVCQIYTENFRHEKFGVNLFLAFPMTAHILVIVIIGFIILNYFCAILTWK